MLDQTTKVFLATIAIVSIGALADDCNVSFGEASGLTYIHTNEGRSLIEVTSPTEWNAYTKSQEENKITNANGDIRRDISPAEDAAWEAKLANFAPEEVNNFGTDGRKLIMESTGGFKWTLMSYPNGTHLLSTRNGDLAAFGLDRTVGDVRVRSIFVQNTSVVTYVNDRCELVTLPKDKLTPEMQQLLNQLSETAEADGEMHILPYNSTDQFNQFRPPPPPPPHGGPFGPHPPPPPHGGPHGPPPPPPHGGPFGRQPHGGPFGPPPPPPHGPFGPHPPHFPFGGPQQQLSFPPPQGQQQMNNGYPSPRSNEYNSPQPADGNFGGQNAEDNLARSTGYPMPQNFQSFGNFPQSKPTIRYQQQQQSQYPRY